MTDQTALNEIRAGSQDALVWVIDKYGAYISTIVWNIIGNSMTISDVEEVSSDVFFALWNRANYIRTASLKSYLAGIARNMAKTKLRNAGHELSLDENVLSIEDIPIEDAYESKALREIVRHTVHNMKEPEREILLRHYFYYQTMEVISKEMGINISTVKTKLRRSKELLKHVLTQRLK